jgi:hypothetical protein
VTRTPTRRPQGPRRENRDPVTVLERQPDAEMPLQGTPHGIARQGAQQLLAHFRRLPMIRAMEQGRPISLNDLGNESRRTLAELGAAVDSRQKDWATFTRQATEFRLKNPRAWANAATGIDLASQIDPHFVMRGIGGRAGATGADPAVESR